MDQHNTLNVEQLLDKAYELRVKNLYESTKLAEQALTLSREMKDSSLIGKSLSKLALFAMIKGENQESLDMSEEAIECFKGLNDERGIADAKYSMAGIYYKTNNYHLGMVYLIDCLKIYRKFQDWHNESRTQKSLGAVYEILGDQNSAIHAYQGAIDAALKAENKNLESNAYNPLSGIFTKIGQPQKALELIERSVNIKQETGDIRGLAFSLYGRGKVFTHLNRFDEAERDLLEALKIHESVNEHLGTGMAYNKIAASWLKMEKRTEAIELFKKAISFSEEHSLSLINYKCNFQLYQLFRREDNTADSLHYLEKYLEAKDAAINSQTLKVIENYALISKMKSMEREASIQREKAEMILRQEQIEQAARMKQEFLSAMSHEIRTPLNAVTGIISLLQERSDENEKKLLTSLRFSAKNLLRIINDILYYSKLDSNKMQLDKHPADFKELLNNIRETYVGLANEKGLNLNVEIDPNLCNSYQLDETKLFQILGNLVSNAIKFTDDGSVTITARLLSTEETGDTVQFNVIDTGIGIPEEEQSKLFESFYMPKSITTRKDGGTGLGLAIVKKLVELYKSEIHIESNVGNGSNFYFNLELKKSNLPLKADLKLFKQLRNKTALLAEDNEINAMVMRELLRKWGVGVQRVDNGEDAVRLAQQKKVDFILMDIHMPKMNGFNASHTIRTTENPNRSTPIFALTADITAATEGKYAVYFNGFLLKPLQIERLFEMLVNTQTDVLDTVGEIDIISE